MADNAGAKATAFPATVEAIDGPVPDDHPSHALRLAAAKDLVERCKRQLKSAEAELERLTNERKKGN